MTKQVTSNRSAVFCEARPSNGPPFLPAAPPGSAQERLGASESPSHLLRDLDLLSPMSVSEEGQGHRSPYLRGCNALARRVEEELPQQVQGLGRGVWQHLS